MTQQKCYVSCGSGIKWFVPLSKHKQNVSISSAEVPRMLRVGLVRQGSYLGTTCSCEMWPQGLCGRLKTYINQGIFWPRRMKQKYREVSPKNRTVTPVSVHFSQLELPLTLPIRKSRVIKKRKEAKQIIIFIHRRCCLFLLYKQKYLFIFLFPLYGPLER